MTLVHAEHVAGRGRQRLLADQLARRHALERGVDRGQQHGRPLAALDAREPRQRGHALRDDARHAARPGRRAGSPRPGTAAPRVRARRTPARAPAPPCAGRRGRPPARWSPARSCARRPRARDRRPPGLRRRRRRWRASAGGRGRGARRAISPWSAPWPSRWKSRTRRNIAVSWSRGTGLTPVSQPSRSRLDARRADARTARVRHRSKRCDMDIGEAAHDQVGLAGAAMPGPKQQPPPADIEAVARSRASGHSLSNAKSPAGAGCGIYIKRRGANVSGAAWPRSNAMRSRTCGCRRSPGGARRPPAGLPATS